MKKLLIILVASFIFFSLNVVAWARNGPHIGPGFPALTDACAGCHRGHTGTQAKLLKSGTNVFEFCTSCHNGTGANDNVVDGRFEGNVFPKPDGTNWGSNGDGTAQAGLNGGGFVNAFSYTGRSNRTTGWGAVSSRHKLVGLDGTGPFTAFGGGSTGYGPTGSGDTSQPVTGGTSIFLECTSCHDPHGTANIDGSERYRILKTDVNADSNYDGDVSSNETPGTHSYTTNEYQSGISENFCSKCHTQYVLKSSKYNANDSKGYNYRYRHTVPATLSLGDSRTGNGLQIATNLNNHTPLPVEQDAYSPSISGNDRLSCLTCHQVHGTSATADSNAQVAPANDSTLLRLSNRGVCQDCHQR